MLKGFNYFLELCAGMAGEMSSRLRGRANTRGKLGPQWYFHTRTLLYQSKNWRVCIFSFNLGELHKILHKEHIVQGTQDGDRFRFEYQLHQLWTSDQLIQPTQCPTSPHPSDLPPDSFPTAKATSASTVSPSPSASAHLFPQTSQTGAKVVQNLHIWSPWGRKVKPWNRTNIYSYNPRYLSIK